MRHPWLLGIVVLVSGGVAVRALWPEKPLEVNAAVVSRGEVALTVVNSRAGTVKACRRARLAPPMGGVVSRLAVAEGDRVAAGALILILWNTDREAQVELARKQMDAARANARESCVLADSAERERARVKRLHAQGLAADEQWDQVRAQAEAQRARCRALQTQVGVSEARLRVAEAELERTRLRAPFAAEVAEVNVAVGEYIGPVAAGGPTPPAVDLIESGCVYVSAPIDEVDAARVQSGLPVRVTLDAFPGRGFPGRVGRAAPYVSVREKQARTREVRVDFTPEVDKAALLPGYSADVEIILERREKVLRVPSEAVVSGNWVWVIGSEGYLQRRKIQTGLANWRWTEVASGLAEGERVVISVDQEGLTEGRWVMVKEGRGE